MIHTILYLYLVTCNGADGCKIWYRYQMPDWRTCQLAVSTFKSSWPDKTTESEDGMALFCAGAVQHFDGENWR